jgi:dolichyl-diphosphooligosaccharide--protein glycosyltransferase
LEILGKSFSIDKKQLFLLVVLFLFAFGIRAHLAKYDLFFGFDSYYHARMVAEVIQNGAVPVIDTMGWYGSEGGGAFVPTSGHFFWNFNAAIYNVVALGGGYNKDLWIMLVKILPALYGALISVAMFFFGKEIYNKRAGYTMAFFAAVIPAFVYRTMGGFLEEDSLGFLWMVIGLVFFARAIKNAEFTRKKIGYAIASGVFFGIMAFTWEMFLLIPLVLTTYIAFATINIYSEKGLKGLVPFLGIFAISMGTFSIITYFVDSGRWIGQAMNYLTGSIPSGLSLLVFGGGIVIIAGIGYLMVLGEKSKNQEANRKTIKMIAMLLLFGTLILLATIILTAPNLWKAPGVHGTSVGEENFGNLYFGEKYNALIVIPFLALLLIPLRIFRKKNDHLSLIVFFWVFATFFMAWYKLKFTYAFGLPIAAAAGLITVELFHFLKSRTEFEKKAIFLALGFMFLIGASAGSLFVEDKKPTIELGNPDWKEALKWLSEETPEDSKMFNWWDYGHWISFVGERAVLTDNRNIYLKELQDVSNFMITNDLNESLRIVKSYDSDYVIFGYDSLKKHVSYARYAYDTVNYDDPRIVPYRLGPNVSFVCNQVMENNQKKYVCGGNVLNEGQAAALRKDWTTQASQLYEQRIPLFIYLDQDSYAMYIVNPAVNSSIAVRLWFHQPEVMQYFEEVYGSRGVKIFRIKKDKIAEVV